MRLMQRTLPVGQVTLWQKEHVSLLDSAACFGPKGAYVIGSVGPKIATDGTSSAAAI